jgi:4-hydroxy-3-polyprenylbenzoate decarboxylase
MSKKPYHIVVGITGASGSIYAKCLIEQLCELKQKNNLIIDLIFSETGKKVFLHENKEELNNDLPIRIFDNDNFFAPFASGSSTADALIIIPCSMGTLGRIAHGTSENLICRTADVVLKEKKKLLLLIRETPLNLIHIKNMELICLAGGTIFPASPSFYLNPETIEDVINSVIFRIIDHLEIDQEIKRWGKK